MSPHRNTLTLQDGKGQENAKSSPSSSLSNVWSFSESCSSSSPGILAEPSLSVWPDGLGWVLRALSNPSVVDTTYL